jgi:hypothetical protein
MTTPEHAMFLITNLGNSPIITLVNSCEPVKIIDFSWLPKWIYPTEIV